LGGFLVNWVDWRFVFYVNIPIGIIGYLAAQVVLTADNDKKEIFLILREVSFLLSA